MAADYHVTVQDVGVCTLRLHGVCRYLRNLMAAGAHSFFAFIFNLKACITVLYPPPQYVARQANDNIVSRTLCRNRLSVAHTILP